MNYQYHTAEMPIELRNAILAQPKTLTQCFMMSLGYMRVTGHPLRIRDTHFLPGVHISVIPEMLLTQETTNALQLWHMQYESLKDVQIIPKECEGVSINNIVLGTWQIAEHRLRDWRSFPTLPTVKLRNAFVDMLDTLPKTLDACVMYALGVELASGDSMLVKHKSFNEFESYIPYVNVQGAVPSLSLRRVRLTTNGEEDNLTDVTLDNVCGLFDDLWHVKPVEPFNPTK